MRIENVEIFSDQANAPVLRHPDRSYPGVLVQGDTLFSLCSRADLACEKVGRGGPGYEELNQLRNTLWSLLNHYKSTLTEHGIQLPFSEQHHS
jgi:hypothetical protein